MIVAIQSSRNAIGRSSRTYGSKSEGTKGSSSGCNNNTANRKVQKNKNVAHVQSPHGCSQLLFVVLNFCFLLGGEGEVQRRVVPYLSKAKDGLVLPRGNAPCCLSTEELLLCTEKFQNRAPGVLTELCI